MEHSQSAYLLRPVKILHKLHELTSKIGHAPESVPDRIIFASMLNDITTGKVGGYKINVQLKRVTWPLAKQISDLVYRHFCGAGSEKVWKYHEERPTHQFADGEWEKLALTLSPVSAQCSSVRIFFQQVHWMKRKRGGV